MVAIRQRPLLIYDKQARFRNSPAWLRGFVAGRGSGKSKIGAIDVLLRARSGDPWMAVSPSYVVLDDTTWPTFEETAKDLGVWVRGIKSPTPRAWFRTQDGGVAEIVFRSGDKPEQLRGPSKAGLWIDEASICHHNVFKYGIAVLRHKGRMGPCILTFTPKGKRHWTFDAFYDRIPDTDVGARFVSEDGRLYYEHDDQATGETRRYGVHEFASVPFLVKPNTFLVHAHTLENPFLPPEFFDNIRGHYTTALAAQELGGEFVELEGLMFMRAWYLENMVDQVPRVAARVRYWDKAATEGGGKYSCGALVAMDVKGAFYIEDIVRGQWSAAARDSIIIETAQQDCDRYGNEVIIYVEQEGGSSGKEVADQMVIKLAGFPIYKDIVSGKRTKIVDKLQLPGEAKIVRAMPHAAQAEAGNVYVKRAKWNHDFLEELCAFPMYAFSDQVDATSGAINKLAGRGQMDPGQIIRTESVGMDESRFGVQLIRSRQRRQRSRG